MSNSQYEKKSFGEIDAVNVTCTGKFIKSGIQMASPATGATVNLNSEISKLILTPTATMTTLTIVIPSDFQIGQDLAILSVGYGTASGGLTITVPSGVTWGSTAPLTLNAATAVRITMGSDGKLYLM